MPRRGPIRFFAYTLQPEAQLWSIHPSMVLLGLIAKDKVGMRYLSLPQGPHQPSLLVSMVGPHYLYVDFMCPWHIDGRGNITWSNSHMVLDISILVWLTWPTQTVIGSLWCFCPWIIDSWSRTIVMTHSFWLVVLQFFYFVSSIFFHDSLSTK